MNKNIIVYSLILILIILIIYLFLGFRQLSSTVSDNDPQSPTSSIPPTVDLSKYYTKSDIDSSFPTKSYVDTNIQNSIRTIRTDQSGNMYSVAGNKEIGYEVDIDGKFNFLSPVGFINHVDFKDQVRFTGGQFHIDHHHRWINTLPKGSIIAWNRKFDTGKWGSDIPRGWAPCDGERYKPDKDGFWKYATQAEVDNGIGTQSPDLRSRFILGAGQGTGLTKREVGDNPGGEEKVALTFSTMPRHDHEFYLDTTTSGYKDKHSDYAHIHKPDGYSTGYDYDWGRSGDYGGPRKRWATEEIAGCAGNNCKDWGQSHPHNNMPPYNVLTYIIKI